LATVPEPIDNRAGLADVMKIRHAALPLRASPQLNDVYRLPLRSSGSAITATSEPVPSRIGKSYI